MDNLRLHLGREICRNLPLGRNRSLCVRPFHELLAHLINYFFPKEMLRNVNKEFCGTFIRAKRKSFFPSSILK